MKRVTHSIQQGFTLIELMIVVAIIGIIVALAVPAYQDYTLKSRISEAGSLSASVRTAIDVAFSEGYSLTALPDRDTLGVATSTSYVSKYVASVGYAPATGAITVTLSGERSLGAEGNKTVVYTPRNMIGNLAWSTSVAGTSTVTPRFLPKP